jgi:hypothetical protein
MDPLYLPRNIFYKKLALTSPTSSGCSVGIVRSRTRATEFNFVLLLPKTDVYSCRQMYSDNNLTDWYNISAARGYLQYRP